MDNALLRSVVPYAVGLAIAVALYVYAGTFCTHRGPVNLGLTCGRALPFC